jgi:transposase-like protein
MKRESRTVDRSHQVDSPLQRHLPLVDLLVDTRAELMELAIASGLKVLTTMLEADRTAICGPRYAHEPERAASRAGTVTSEVVLGGRKVQIRRPRVRAAGAEVPLPTFEAFAETDPLNRRVVEQMLLGVATRQYGRSLEPVGAEVRVRGTSKSAVSRRFVVKTTAQLDAWRSTALDAINLVALLIDGLHVGEHCIVVALGIDTTGAKHALGLWDGSTENAALCQSLLADLQSRGLRTDRSLLIILDGSKALHKAVTQTFGSAALIHRCHVHKLRNILEHLPEGQRPWVRAIVARAYKQAEVATARRAAAGSGPTTRGPLSECRSERPRRPRRDAHRADAQAVRSTSPVPRDDQRHRKLDQPLAAREAECETVAWRADGAAMDRGRHPRSRQRLSPIEGSSGHASARRCPSCS